MTRGDSFRSSPTAHADADMAALCGRSFDGPPVRRIQRTADDDEPTLPAFPDITETGEAIIGPPLDNTPNELPGDPPTRIPHLGHALLLLLLTIVFLALAQGALFLRQPSVHATKLPPVTQTLPQAAPRVQPRADNTVTLDPKLAMAAEAITFAATLGVSFFLFPRLWRRPFLAGISWNADAAKRNAIRLIPLGLMLSFLVQGLSTLVSVPKSIPVDDFFRTATDAWIVTLFGICVAPIFEEIFFRGFLVPAFAIAYDWLALPRTPAAREAWHGSNALTPAAFAFSAVLTSVLFGLLHGKQIAFTWPIILLLSGVSLVLTAVRIRFRSVACSAVVHASYNFAVFLSGFIATGGYRHLEKLSR